MLIAFNRHGTAWCYTAGSCLLLVSTQQNEMSQGIIVDLWFCLARALGFHLLGGLRFCGANKPQALQNPLSHLHHSDIFHGSAWCTAEVVSVNAMG